MENPVKRLINNSIRLEIKRDIFLFITHVNELRRCTAQFEKRNWMTKMRVRSTWNFFIFLQIRTPISFLSVKETYRRYHPRQKIQQFVFWWSIPIIDSWRPSVDGFNRAIPLSLSGSRLDADNNNNKTSDRQSNEYEESEREREKNKK